MRIFIWNRFGNFSRRKAKWGQNAANDLSAPGVNTYVAHKALKSFGRSAKRAGAKSRNGFSRCWPAGSRR